MIDDLSMISGHRFVFQLLEFRLHATSLFSKAETHNLTVLGLKSNHLWISEQFVREDLLHMCYASKLQQETLGSTFLEPLESMHDVNFFYTMLLFWPHNVNPLFSRGWGQQNNNFDFFASSEIKRSELLTICIKTIKPSCVNRFDGVIPWYGFNYKKKIWNDTTKL